MAPDPLYAGRVALIVTNRAGGAGGPGGAEPAGTHDGFSGAGLAIAEVFARHGAQLVLTSPTDAGAPSPAGAAGDAIRKRVVAYGAPAPLLISADITSATGAQAVIDRKSTRLNSSH